MFRSVAHSARPCGFARPGLFMFALLAGSAQAQVGIQEIGTPGPGGTSLAFGVSADGSTVVGYTSFSPPPLTVVVYEAFRWTASGGLVGLGDLPGGTFESRGFGISGSGSTCVGSSDVAGGSNAFSWTQGGGMPTGVGIGIATGEAIIGNIGSPHHMSYTIIGDAVNTAARLMQMARAGELLVSGGIYDSIRALVPEGAAVSRGNVALRGKTEPTPVYSIELARPRIR